MADTAILLSIETEDAPKEAAAKVHEWPRYGGYASK